MPTREITETIWAWGHKNIQATHLTTLMITKDSQLLITGDCIVAVSANRAITDLSATFKEALHQPNTKLIVLIETDNLMEKIEATGSPDLQLNHPSDLVIRKSRFICNRTLAIQANRAANNLSREFVTKLKNPQQKIKITLIITPHTKQP
ncbi:MAG: DUF371 domain-containing protein [Nitrososphaerota archaeon]|nr:DUF371 domain-containing protein [Nitrososphaerota archaeon]